LNLLYDKRNEGLLCFTSVIARYNHQNDVSSNLDTQHRKSIKACGSREKLSSKKSCLLNCWSLLL